VKGQTEKIEVIYGKAFDYGIVYAPLDNTLICIEPQTGPTNAFNLEHEGKFKGLLTLEPGQTFKASYWIVPTGF
jgi:galactose mutarotase-like enzyme